MPPRGDEGRGQEGGEVGRVDIGARRQGRIATGGAPIIYQQFDVGMEHENRPRPSARRGRTRVAGKMRATAGSCQKGTTGPERTTPRARSVRSVTYALRRGRFRGGAPPSSLAPDCLR